MSRTHLLVRGLGLVALLISLSAPICWADPSALNFGGPAIVYASPVQPSKTQKITIIGSGFGTQSPFSGISPYIKVVDLTRTWAAGFTGPVTMCLGAACGPENDAVGVNVTSWSDRRIVINGFTGSYGGGSPSGQWVFARGDVVLIFVGNPTTGVTAWLGNFNAAPSVCTAVVGSHAGCAGPSSF